MLAGLQLCTVELLQSVMEGGTASLFMMQAIESGVCDSLAEISASQHPEEQTAAGRALSLILQGAASSVKAAPGLGAKAAATAGQAAPSGPPFPEAATGEPGTDLIAARRFRCGGGIPQSSLFPLLQIVAMQDVATSTVELHSTLHALLTAAESTDLRKAMRECVPLNLVFIIPRHGGA